MLSEVRAASGDGVLRGSIHKVLQVMDKSIRRVHVVKNQAVGNKMVYLTALRGSSKWLTFSVRSRITVDNEEDKRLGYHPIMTARKRRANGEQDHDSSLGCGKRRYGANVALKLLAITRRAGNMPIVDRIYKLDGSLSAAVLAVRELRGLMTLSSQVLRGAYNCHTPLLRERNLEREFQEYARSH